MTAAICWCIRHPEHAQHIIIPDEHCPSHIPQPDASRDTVRFNNIMSAEGYTPWPQARRTV